MSLYDQYKLYTKPPLPLWHEAYATGFNNGLQCADLELQQMLSGCAVNWDDVINTLTDVCQLLDGWHCDTAWSEWDTQVRNKVSVLLKAAYAAKVTNP